MSEKTIPAGPQSNRVNVVDNLGLYVFTGEHVDLPDTITVMENGKEALLIDTAFPPSAEKVKQDLEVRGVVVKTVIFSHYHSDHTAGCSVFAGCRIYANENYEGNYNNCRVWEPGYDYLKPDQLLKHGDKIEFGDFCLDFVHAPGHSKCSMITRINDKIVHAGDLLMMTGDGKAALPFIADGGNFADHIASLEALQTMDPDILILPHFGMIDDKGKIAAMIEDRIHYLTQTSASMGTLPLQACLKNDISTYAHLEFHDTNLVRLLQ